MDAPICAAYDILPVRTMVVRQSA